MAFEPIEAISQIPTEIKDVIVVLQCTKSEDELGNPILTRSAKFQLNVTDQNGQQMGSKAGQLTPHLTSAQKQWLQTFMDDLRALAEAALPQP